jgi:1,4-dihydroxy-6-naphthoate synthase
MDEKRTDQFIGMYVNDLTLDFGDRGRTGLKEFFGRAHKSGLIPKIPSFGS